MAEMKVLTIDGLTYLVEKIDEKLDQKVTKVEGKGLSENDFTNEYKQTIDGLVSTGGQSNVIEIVKVNGTAIVPDTSKAVNIDLSAYAVKSEMQTALDGKVDKADGMGLMSDAEKAKIANLADNANETYATKAELSTIPKFGKIVVDELPATGEDDKIYLVPNKGNGTNARDEYIYVNGAWEMLGTTETDLTGYYTKEQVDEMIGAIEGDVDAVYTKTEIDGMVQTINGDIEAVEGDVADLEAKFADYYTKAQVDSAIDADVAVVDGRITSEVATLNTAIDKKLNSADLVAITDGEIDTAFA